MWEMAEQHQRLFSALHPYICNACNNIAEHPVLPPCGHLHCWKCLHNQNQCSLCGNSFQKEDLFVIFINHQQPIEQGLPLPPKPKPRYTDRIRNSGGLAGFQTSNMRFQNNLETGVQLAGYGYCPPLVVNALNSISEQVEEQSQGVKGPWRYVELLLITLLFILCWIV